MFIAPDPASVAPLKHRPAGGRWIGELPSDVRAEDATPRSTPPDPPVGQHVKPKRKCRQNASPRAPYPRFSPKELRIIDAFYTLGLPDAFTATFLRCSTPAVTGKRIRSGIFRSLDEIADGGPRYSFRMTRPARDHLRMLEAPDSWLCDCLDAFPQFVTSYATGIANDSR